MKTVDAFHDLDGIALARAALRDVLRGLDLEREDHRRALGHVVAALQQLALLGREGGAEGT